MLKFRRNNVDRCEVECEFFFFLIFFFGGFADFAAKKSLGNTVYGRLACFAPKIVTEKKRVHQNQKKNWIWTIDRFWLFAGRWLSLDRRRRASAVKRLAAAVSRLAHPVPIFFELTSLYICMLFVLSLFWRLSVWVSVWCVWVSECVCVCVYVCACVHACMHACTCLWVHSFVQSMSNGDMCACVYVCTHTHTHIHIYTCICTHTYIYI